MQRIIRTFLILSFSFLLVFSAWKIIDILHSYQVGKDAYTALEQYVSISDQTSATEPALPENNDPAVKEENPNTAVQENINWPQVNFAELSKINPDVVGWIYIEGTNINYPIAQASDNDYYMTRLFDGTYNSSGSIFLDASASPDFSDKHTIIFGHNMKDNTMFSALMGYKDEAFYREHPDILLLTPERNYRIRLFSGYITDTSVNAWERKFTQIDFPSWLSEIVSRSQFKPDQYPDQDDRIISLSTCSYEFDDAKYILHGYIAYEEENDG